MLSTQAFFSRRRELNNVHLWVKLSAHHCFIQLTNQSGGGAGLIPSHPACTTTEQQWRS